VTPPPIVAHLGLPVRSGRLVVDEYLKLRDRVWAAGDSAAAIDPYDRDEMDYPPTAQHAQRQGTVIARNVAASLGVGTPTTYRHRDLGLVADLGGAETGIIRQLPDGGFTEVREPVSDETRAVLSAKPAVGALPAADVRGIPGPDGTGIVGRSLRAASGDIRDGAHISSGRVSVVAELIARFSRPPHPSVAAVPPRARSLARSRTRMLPSSRDPCSSIRYHQRSPTTLTTRWALA
jgi:hypothetical protein